MGTGRSGAIVVLALASLLPGACQSMSAAPDASSRLDRFLSDLHGRGLFDGAVVVAEGDRIIYEKGFGFADAERRAPFTPDTPSDGGSLAKTFTAALLLQLESEGLLDLDDPARTLLPELPYPEITLRHLITHSSGLPFVDYGQFDPYIPADRVRTTQMLLDVVGAQRVPVHFKAGTGFEYHSFGFDLAALAASRAAGKPYGDLLRERFFEPLNITSAFLRPGRLSDFPGVRTRGYRRSGPTLEPNEVFDFEGFHGGSNIYISARDLHRWNQSFLRSPRLDASALASALGFARIGNAPSGLTLGSWYALPDRSLYWYSGHLEGFHSEVFRDLRKGRSIVYVSNNTMEPWVQKGLVRGVTAILDGAAATLQPPATEEVPKELRASLAGVWEVEGGERLEIATAPNSMQMVRQGVTYRMFPAGGHTFYVPGLDLMVGFARDGEGRMARIHLSGNADERWGVRRSR